MTKSTDSGSTDQRTQVVEERRRWIEERVRREGRVSVHALEAELGVSAMTARRDLDALSDEGKVQRIYGGAVMPVIAAREDFFHWRVNENRKDKERLADAALELVEPGDTVFIDSSTTALYLVRRMVAESTDATIVTNSLAVQDVFTRNTAPGLELVVVGGSLKKPTLSLVGPNAVRNIGLYLADKVFLSTWGIEPGGDLTDPDLQEAEIKRAMIARTKEPVLMADGSKFEKRAMHVYAHASEFSTILATNIPESRMSRLNEVGSQVRSV